MLVWPDGPQAQRPPAAVPGQVGIRYVKDVAEPGPASAGINQGNTVCAPVDPAAHLLIPEGQLRAGRRVRALAVNQELVGKTVLVDAGGGIEILPPRATAGGQVGSKSIGQADDRLQRGCHKGTPFLLRPDPLARLAGYSVFFRISSIGSKPKLSV